MKKKTILLVVSLTLATTPALADVYVKVDANGNAIGGAIVCDSATCGEGSLYSQLTLGAGERYALQGYGTTGIGNNTPDTQLQVTSENVWTITTPIEVRTFTPQPEPIAIPVAPLVPPVTDTTTVITDTATVLTDTTTVTTLESMTATVTESVTVQEVILKINAILELIRKIWARLGL